jgi:CRISPR-associated endonuclease/helicase Cas3
VVQRLGLPVNVVVLMGGVDDSDEWDTRPEEDVIIIGTQDMLLSRALNRGYGMSRYRWPLHFGLLNTDSQWIIDEVQLVGTGVATTTQLQALRRKLGTALPTRTSWMSATLEEDWLRTVDVEDTDIAGHLALDETDRANSVVQQRITSQKATDRARSAMGELKNLASEIRREHRAGTRTLVIVNTVERARELFVHLRKIESGPELVLLHSRFRTGVEKTKAHA